MNRLARMQLAESRRAIEQAEGSLRGAARLASALDNFLHSPPRRSASELEAKAEADYLQQERDRVEAYVDELEDTIADHRSRVARLTQQERIG